MYTRNYISLCLHSYLYEKRIEYVLFGTLVRIKAFFDN